MHYQTMLTPLNSVTFQYHLSDQIVW